MDDVNANIELCLRFEGPDADKIDFSSDAEVFVEYDPEQYIPDFRVDTGYEYIFESWDIRVIAYDCGCDPL